MKKVFFVLGLTVLLSGCNFQSREDFEKDIKKEQSQLADDFEMPKITYVPADVTENTESSEPNDKDDEKLNFKEMYGEGRPGKNLDPAANHGNIKDLNLGDTQIGISIVPSIQRPGGYSSLLTYKRNEELVEREFGPVGGMSGVTTYVSYDKIDSESGPMLLVSQVSVINNQTFSAYYLFNRYMSLLDYLVFSSSTDNVMPTVERLGDVIEFTDQALAGSLDEAIKRRKEAEDRHLGTLLDVYGIKKRPLTALVNERETEIGFLPDIPSENRILLVKTASNPVNSGMYIDIE